MPFDSGTSYRPGARFGLLAVRTASRLIRVYHPGLDVEPFRVAQVVDAGDIAPNPFDIAEAIGQIEAGARELLADASHVVAIGGDHTIALPLLRADHAKWGPIALVHFDAHLDTWDAYFGAPYTRGTPFRRAWEEGLLADAAVHVGIRGPIYSPTDLTDDAGFGFRIVSAMDIESIRIEGVVQRIRERVGDLPVYVSIDIDVLDPSAAPGTGTPEADGLTSRELMRILRGLLGVRLVGGDVVDTGVGAACSFLSRVGELRWAEHARPSWWPRRSSYRTASTPTTSSRPTTAGGSRSNATVTAI